MAKKQLRTITLKSDVSLQEDGEKKTIVGKIPYNSASVDMGFIEVIMNSAFTKSLNDGSDIKAYFNHDTGKVLGRVKNGSLKLTSMEDGLLCECTLPDTSFGHDAYSLIKDGYCQTMSFGFTPIQTDIKQENGEIYHYLRETRLWEVSFCVPEPAYLGTDSAARSLFKAGVDIDGLISIANKDALEDDDYVMLSKCQEAIRNFLAPKDENTTAAIEASTDTVAVADDGIGNFLKSFMTATK